MKRETDWHVMNKNSTNYIILFVVPVKLFQTFQFIMYIIKYGEEVRNGLLKMFLQSLTTWFRLA